MVDTRTPAQRRKIMQAVKPKNTKPELMVRRLLFSHGYRYRLHDRRIPGKPDIVFPSRRKAIFVHGCFWHAHGCKKGKPPKSRSEYWLPKLAANADRDQRKQRELFDIGWKVLVVWQCEIDDIDALRQKLVTFVEGE